MLGQEHIKNYVNKNRHLLASKMTNSDRQAFYPRITFILLFGSAMEVLLCMYGDLNNGCYVFHINNDFNYGALLLVTDTTDPSDLSLSVATTTTLNLTAMVLTEIKMKPVALIDNENEFNGVVAVATDTRQTERLSSSQTAIVYRNTGISLAGYLVLRCVFYIVMDEMISFMVKIIKIWMKINVQIDK